MKANEMMHGDFFKLKDTNELFIVDNIDPPYVTAFHEEGQFHEDNIEDISLTVDFLLRNGFKIVTSQLSEDYYEKYFTDGILTFEYELFSNKVVLYTSIGYKNIDIFTVNKLQHIYRLCNLEKILII